MQRRYGIPAAATAPPAFELGRAEWVTLPDLGIPAVLAKIDTGARTSALHAEAIEIRQTAGGPRVHFIIHPIVRRRDVAVACEAPLIARRWVASSNGERELRCVIGTTVAIGGRRWPIEATLSNRDTMRFRMLLGQQAILDDMVVVPNSASRQAVIGYDCYSNNSAIWAHQRDRVDTGRRLRIGLIGEGVVGPLWQPLADAAQDRGHLVERIDADRCRLVQADGRPQIECAGKPIAVLDAALALGQASAGSFLSAVLRHAELGGAVTLNSAAAIASALDPVHVVQVLWAARVPTIVTALSSAATGPSDAVTVGADRFDGLVVDGKVVAVAPAGGSPPDVAARPEAQERGMMVRAAKALGLGLVRVDLVRSGTGQLVVSRCDAAVPLDKLAAPARKRVALTIVRALERRAKMALPAP